MQARTSHAPWGLLVSPHFMKKASRRSPALFHVNTRRGEAVAERFAE
jgi:hypothetical protein